MNKIIEKLDKCVYLHIYNGLIVYIGSGTINRAYSKHCRSEKHRKIFDDIEVFILFKNISEKLSKSLEQILLDYCWNCNLLNKNKKSGKIKSINYDKIKQYLIYDETSPTFIRWRDSDNVRRDFRGRIAGHISKLGYIEITINRVRYYGHRIVMALINKSDIQTWAVVDHIDGNKSNNNITNLRLTTQSANMRNKITPNLSTGISNISEYTKKQLFSVGYKIDFKQYRVYFSYSQKNIRNSNERWYKSREEALAAALDYKEKLKLEGIL